MREENQLKLISRILENYHLDQPLSRYLKDFYKTHPQMGSRDRRQASGFIYNYFRIGRALTDVRMIEKLTIANFLCQTTSNPLLAYCLDKFTLISESAVESPLSEKMLLIQKQYSTFNREKIFPFVKHLSSGLEKENFIDSFLKQPNLWIRVRKGFSERVCEEFNEKNILFEIDSQNPLTFSLVNSVSLENTDSYRNGFFEIQDWSSQQTISFIRPKGGETFWDACCGSGGKSLMIADAEPSVNIFATDNRVSILKNLEDRFIKSGLVDFKKKQLDVSSPTIKNEIPDSSFDAIVADVPCSGSGTWGRTPEWLTQFNEDAISRFVSEQRKIIKNLSGFLPSGKRLVYITCSVFVEENEQNVEWLLSNSNLFLEESSYINGFSRGADSMFAAVLIKK